MCGGFRPVIARNAMVVLLAACGPGSRSTPNDAAEADAATDAVPECFLPQTLGTVTLRDGSEAFESGFDGAVVRGVVADGTQFFVETQPGRGVFTEHVVGPGTFKIAGAELQYAECGICLTLLTNSYADWLATGGAIAIASVRPRFVATLTNVTYQHVMIADVAPFTSTPHPSGCTTAIDSLSFDLAVQ
jgi:hypothetical protein